MSIPEAKSVTIFLVDDDDIDAIGIERALKKQKIANPLVRAHDGQEALEMLREKGRLPKPFIMLLDINMPRMDGFELLEVVRSDPELSSSVIFMLTTSDDETDKMSAYTKHVAGYIVKNKVGEGFMELIAMLDHYWRVVELPLTE